MDDLVAFIEAQLAEDERLARRAGALCGCHPPALSWQFGEATTDGRIIAEGDGHPDIRPRGRLARRWSTSYNDMFAAGHVVRHDPARVLRDVEAKRRTLARHAPHHHGACPTCWRVTERSSTREDFPCPTLLDLAAPYADHPGFRPEWLTEERSDG